MRITNAMMVSQFLTESNEALERVSKYQSQVDSTKRINTIADDPQATLLALRARNKLTNLEMYNTNIRMASSYLKEAESAVMELNEILKSAYEDLVYAHSGAKEPEDLAAIAENMKNLRDEVLAISNSSIGTSYLFGGYNYTGSYIGGVKNPPFSVDPVTGDLTYNGVNLSQFAWSDEYANHTEQMSQSASKVAAIAAEFSVTASDFYNKSQAQTAVVELGKLIAAAEAAMEDAKEFGIDINSASFMQFETFYNDLKTAVDALSFQVSKELAEDGVVYDPEELANKFNSADVLAELNNVAGLLDGVPSVMEMAISALQSDFDTVIASAQTALDEEMGKTTTLQIGTSQTIDATLTGLDLLGLGSNNVYHILDKVVKALTSGAGPDELSQLLTTLQNAQSNVLMQATRIGASQNRLKFFSNRYETSEINYTQMRSDAEDVDMAEAIMNLTTAQTVYNAALAGGAEILRTSLIDFLR